MYAIIGCSQVHVVLAWDSQVPQYYLQGFIQDFLLGVGNFFRKANVLVGGRGGILSGVHYLWRCHARGVWGHSPRNFFEI